MIDRWIKSAMALLLASQAAPVSAAQANRDDQDGRWVVEWDRLFCAMARSERASGTSIVLQSMPGSWTWRLRLTGPAALSRRLAQTNALSLSLQPSGRALSGRLAAAETESGQDALDVDGLPFTLLDDIAGAESIRVAFRGNTLFDVPLAQTAPAIRSVRQCERTALQELGASPAQVAAVAIPPRGNIAEVFEGTDFPPASARGRSTGDVVLFLMIGATGQATDCRILSSSGHALIDREVCTLFTLRFRAEPARDGAGNPVPAPLVAPVNWIVSR